jgi:hypothetical protein
MIEWVDEGNFLCGCSNCLSIVNNVQLVERLIMDIASSDSGRNIWGLDGASREEIDTTPGEMESESWFSDDIH